MPTPSIKAILYIIPVYVNNIYIYKHIYHIYTNIKEWIRLALQSKQLFPHLRPTQTSARNMINSSSKDDPWVAATCAEDFIGAPNTSTVGREINHHPQFEIAAPHIDGKWLIAWRTCSNNLSSRIQQTYFKVFNYVASQCLEVSRTILPLEGREGNWKQQLPIHSGYVVFHLPASSKWPRLDWQLTFSGLI